MMFIIFTEPKALDSIWIIGDTFVSSSYERMLKMDNNEHNQNKLYIREQYDVFAHFNTSHFDTNFLSRLRNVLVATFNKSDQLPRAIIVILDNDLLCFINHNKFSISLEIGTELDWLVDEFHLIIEKRLSQLPVKSKKPPFPHLI